VPGLDGVLPGAGGLAAQVVRTGANQWLIGIGDLDGALAAAPVTDPGVVAAGANCVGPGFVARVELDTCGAWVTMACTADLRPLVVRRAGWVDERGDIVVARDRSWPEDRVGLGPGDAVALVHRLCGADEHDDGRDVDPVAEHLLHHLGSGAQGLVDALPAPGRGTGPGPGVVAALAVPAAVAGAGTAWVEAATGVAEADLVLPGYPQGDGGPERWRRPPSTPRRATFLLHRDPTRLHDLRGVLGRLVSSWRLEECVDDGVLALLTTELATNAIVHTEMAATATITYFGPFVRVDVHDGSARLAERRDFNRCDIGGRGMALVEAMAADWGSVVTPSGKRTWFDLKVGQPSPDKPDKTV